MYYILLLTALSTGVAYLFYKMNQYSIDLHDKSIDHFSENLRKLNARMEDIKEKTKEENLKTLIKQVSGSIEKKYEDIKDQIKKDL